MPDSSMLARHLATLSADAPALAQRLVDACLKRLLDPQAQASAEELRKTAGAAAKWLGPCAPVLAGDLAQRLQTAVSEAQARGRPAAPAPRPMASLSLSDLTLVDEDQAELDIEISRIVQAIDLKAEWELRELMGKVRALDGGPSDDRRSVADHYPVAPGVVARAFSHALQGLGPDAAVRRAVMRAAAPALAEALRDHYRTTGEQLQHWGAPEPEYKAMKSPVAGLQGTAPAAAPVAAHAHPGAGMGAPGAASGPAPAGFDLQALAQLLASLPQGVQWRLQPTGDAGASAPVGSASGPAAPVSNAVLQGLFQQMSADTRLEGAVRRAIGRLEETVLRLAEADPTLLTNEHHPTWNLINQIASHAAEHPIAQDPRGTDFLEFVEPVVQRLAKAPQPARADFELALADVQSYIADDQARQVARTAPAREALRQVEQEQQLVPLLRQQVEIQLAKAPPISSTLHRFLTGPWSEVLAHAMSTQGDESPQTQALIGTVDELLASLQVPRSDAARARVMQGLPALIERLKEGMALIDLPPEQGDRVLDDLMATHRRVLFPAPSPTPSSPAAAPAERDDDPSTDIQWDDSAYLQEKPSDRWQGSDTNVGGLPTVPMALDAAAAAESSSAWLDTLRMGTRCKVFLQGEWTTARLVWRSDNGQFFMFTSPLAGGAHSMTRRAIERLRAEGLLTAVAEPNLVQRAMHGLREHLDSGMY
jgi:hypothetical protein